MKPSVLGHSAGWNQYAYATNPNSMIDPTGLDSCQRNIQGICDRHPSGTDPILACMVSIDGGSPAPCGLVGSSESGAICSYDIITCSNLTVTVNNEVYAHYYSNPDIFQCDGSLSNINCAPTHWVSTYLGNVLPSSITCVYMAGICDVPLSTQAQATLAQSGKLMAPVQPYLQGAFAIEVGVGSMATPFAYGVTAKQAIGSLLLAGTLDEFFEQILDPATVVPVHDPSQEPGYEEPPIYGTPISGDPPE